MTEIPKPRFEELDFRETELGDLILRRRTILALENLEIYEVILGDAFLMSSLFTVVEEELSNLGLAAAEAAFQGEKLDVVVGGLGLGYTAKTALDHKSVGSLNVVDFLKPVIEWHEAGLVPLGKRLTDDSRCRFVHSDFFGLSFDPEDENRKFHAVLLDIDHSPANLLHERHQDFYSPAGLTRLAGKLHAGGIFALWSDDPPEETFMDSLSAVFESVESHVVSFFNPLRDCDSESTVYVAKLAGS